MLQDLLRLTKIDTKTTIELQIYKPRANDSTFAINYFNGTFMISCLAFLIEASWRRYDLARLFINPNILVTQFMIPKNLNIRDS